MPGTNASSETNGAIPLMLRTGLGGHQATLGLFLALELITFSILGTNFLSRNNAFEIVRLSVEVGLLALAMTPVIITGGIDLSVGSLMGLSAVLFGKMWRDGGIPIEAAALCTLAIGGVAGGLNALLITRLRLPPLIVTLGTFSLFRGLAEGLTGGVDNFTAFPSSFLFLGQSYFLGGIPAQLPIFAAVAIGFWLLLHRSIIGRDLFAIGFSPEGSRYAGIPVERRLILVYVLTGVVASLAALIYAAHLGEAKADAGMGYELLAITAVVLGGTSIFGGRGSIHGTLLGLFIIAVLQNGLRLADLPGELAGILTGVLLLATISVDWLRWVASTKSANPRLHSPSIIQEEFVVKNSQIAVLSLVILAAALIVAASNWLLVKSLRQETPGPRTASTDVAPPSRPVTVAMMPKSKGNDYFRACRKGAEEAAAELGVELIWDGPTESATSAKQTEIIDTWITRGVDVIAVAVENRDGISTVLRKARQHGIKVITWDADAEPDARDFFVNQATPQSIGYTLMDKAAEIMEGKGEFAIITASLTAANMIEWQKNIESRRADRYPNITMVELRPCDDKDDKAFNETKTILNAHPDVKLIMAICSPAVPAAAEAVKQSGRKDVKVIGLGLPNANKSYVHEDITKCVVLWNTRDLGYLTVYSAFALQKGTLKPGAHSLQAGRLNRIEIEGDNILLGQLLLFNHANIDKFDF